MTDLSHDAPLRFKGVPKAEVFTLDTTSAQTVYKGQPLILLATLDTLNAKAFVGGDEVILTTPCLGIAAEHKVVAAGDVEANSTIEAYVYPTIIGFKSTVFTSGASLGLGVYMTDSGTLAGVASADDAVYLGTLYCIEDGYCYVRLTTPNLNTGAGTN
jgi:hypothetical protein